MPHPSILRVRPLTFPTPSSTRLAPRLYFAVNYRSGIMRPATVSRAQDKGTLAGQEDAPPDEGSGSIDGRHDLGDRMKGKTLAKTISLVALLLALAHLLFPNVRVDLTTVFLFVVAALPWLAPLFKSVELPGGLKVEFRDLEKAKEDAARVGLLANPIGNRPEPSFMSVAQEDPNLALAGLRIEIERRLGSIARARGLDSRRSGVGQLLRQLASVGAVSQAEVSVLNDLVILLNRAVHGAEVEPRAAQWAIEIGPSLLAALDELARKPQKA